MKQLSRTQLKNIKAGNPFDELPNWLCTIFYADKPSEDREIRANSATEAADALHALYGGIQINCSKDHRGSSEIL